MPRDLARPRDQRIKWLYGWEPFMISYYPFRLGGHRYCDSGDMIFLAVEGQDSTCSCLNPPLLFIYNVKHMTYHAHTIEISGLRHNNLPVYQMKDVRYWSHMSNNNNWRKLHKTLLLVYLKAATRKKRRAINHKYQVKKNTTLKFGSRYKFRRDLYCERQSLPNVEK